VWEDVDLLWNGLDSIKARIPEMILATTAQAKGCDAVAHAWAASRGVKVIQFRLDRSQGNRAAFVRNDRILGLKPVEAVICEGSGIQQNLAQKLRQAGVPLHIVRLAHQRTQRSA
jgi:aryl carrier-like protein